MGDTPPYILLLPALVRCSNKCLVKGVFRGDEGGTLKIPMKNSRFKNFFKKNSQIYNYLRTNYRNNNMKITDEQIRQIIKEELRKLSNESMDAGDMAQKFYPAASPKDEAYGNWKSAVLRYMSDDVQYDAEQRFEAAEAAEEAAYAALDSGLSKEDADEVGDFLDKLYASGDLN